MKIEIPDVEGHELAEGKQPRIPKKGESFTRLGGQLYTCEHNEMVDAYIILKKKAPKYRVEPVLCASDPRCLHGKTIKMVEIKALEDAVALIYSEDLTVTGLDKLTVLKELLR